MTTTWIKHGRLFEPAGQAAWIGTHAALPIVDLAGQRAQLYVTSRDGNGRSVIGLCDLELDEPRRIVPIGESPVLAAGPLGAFDDAGVSGACLVRHDDLWFLYYTGWSLGVSVPFYLQTGLAVSEDGVTFRRWSHAPLLDRRRADPYLNASPWVLREGNTWRMWYVAGTGWEVVGGAPRHRYHIQYAESSNGVDWIRDGIVSITYRDETEYAFGRPCVIRDAGRYRMWYSHRGDGYRLGYAESADGITWQRKDDDAGVVPSAEGWDAEMVMYPSVFSHRGRLHMLYNGNGYGRTGIGLATES